MSWYNPTPEEAEDCYYFHKGRYERAAQEKRASEQAENRYRTEKATAQSTMNNLRSDKINFEKRLKGIEDIIKMLEGNGGWFSNNVPDAISKAGKQLEKAEESYKGSIRLTGGGTQASLETAFHTPTVGEESHSAAALTAYKQEKTRLEQAIADVNRQLGSLSSTIDNLNQKIRDCNATQASLSSSMWSSAYDMNHYRKYF